MNPSNKYDRFKSHRAELSDALALLASTIGRDQDPHYTIGYITEFIADHIAHQSKAQRDAFLASVQDRINTKSA